MAHIFDSDSSNESDFEGFSESDIEVPLEHEDSDSSEYESDDDLAREDGWTRNYSDIRIEDFTEQPGPHIPDGFDVHSASAIDFFWLVFPVRLLELIVRYTNRYAEWKQQQDGPDSYWQETTLPEMRAFIGINILMGIMQVPRLEQCWSSDPFYGNAGIQKVMTCNRFQKLSQYFHVSDREAEPEGGTNEYDVLYKVREIMNYLSVSFRNAFTLNREVSVDEGMIKYAGRLSIRQYMPTKPIKRGVKVWMLCDANTGYLSKFEIYKGRENKRTEHGLGFNVVNKMTENIKNTFRWVFFDNYFTGIPLMRTLLQNGLYACGTVRTNRVGFPKDLVKPRDMPNREDFKVVQNGDTNLTASVWKDAKLVHHLSTCSRPTDIRQAQRRVNRQAVLVRQPHSVHIYNRFIGGVDRHDQFRAKYPVGRNGKKWWHYIFWFLINSSIVNANIIYKEASSRITMRKRFEHLDFLMELVNQLIGGYAKMKRPSPDAGNFCGVLLQNAGAHVSSRLPGKKTTCKYHMRQLGQRRETVYGCVICNVHLCKDCHARFHDM